MAKIILANSRFYKVIRLMSWAVVLGLVSYFLIYLCPFFETFPDSHFYTEAGYNTVRGNYMGMWSDYYNTMVRYELMPLFPLLIGILSLAIPPLLASEVIVLICTVLLACMVYIIGKRLKDPVAGFAASFLLLTNPFFLYYGTRCFTEPLFMLLCLVSLYFALGKVGEGQTNYRRNLILCSTFFSLAILCRSQAWFLAPFVVLFIISKTCHLERVTGWFKLRLQCPQLKALAISLAVLIVPLLLFFGVNMHYFGHPSVYFTPHFTSELETYTWAQRLAASIGASKIFWALAQPKLYLSIPLLLGGAFWLLKRKKLLHIALPLIMFVTFPILLTPALAYARYTVTALPFFCLIVGCGLSWFLVDGLSYLFKRRKKVFLWGLIVVALVAFLGVNTRLTVEHNGYVDRWKNDLRRIESMERAIVWLEAHPTDKWIFVDYPRTWDHYFSAKYYSIWDGLNVTRLRNAKYFIWENERITALRYPYFAEVKEHMLAAEGIWEDILHVPYQPGQHLYSFTFLPVFNDNGKTIIYEIVGETPEANEFETLVVSEGEINSLLSKATSSVAKSGILAKLDYTFMRVRLIEDKMFLSVSAEALGIKLEAKNIDVCFQGTEVSASGEAKVGGLPVTFSGKANIILSNGKLTIDIETIDLGIVSLFVPQLRKENLNQYLNQKLAENPFLLPLSELEEITIKDGKLIIKGR